MSSTHTFALVQYLVYECTLAKWRFLNHTHIALQITEDSLKLHVYITAKEKQATLETLLISPNLHVWIINNDMLWFKNGEHRFQLKFKDSQSALCIAILQRMGVTVANVQSGNYGSSYNSHDTGKQAQEQQPETQNSDGAGAYKGYLDLCGIDSRNSGEIDCTYAQESSKRNSREIDCTYPQKTSGSETDYFETARNSKGIQKSRCPQMNPQKSSGLETDSLTGFPQNSTAAMQIPSAPLIDSYSQILNESQSQNSAVSSRRIYRRNTDSKPPFLQGENRMDSITSLVVLSQIAQTASQQSVSNLISMESAASQQQSLTTSSNSQSIEDGGIDVLTTLTYRGIYIHLEAVSIILEPPTEYLSHRLVLYLSHRILLMSMVAGWRLKLPVIADLLSGNRRHKFKFAH